jgi:ABC-type multidrug transport system fused ATPase/permease subunit
VVSDGRIVESGTPDDLRARGGRFAELFSCWLAGAA